MIEGVSRIRFGLACAYFVLLVTIVGFGCALAILLYRVVFSRMMVFLLAATFTAGCAHRPEVPPVPQEIEKVFLPASVPATAWFCVEDHLHTRSGWKCALTVGDVRRYVAGLQAAE